MKKILLTVRHVAVMIDCHVNTVLRYLDEGKLQGHNANGPGVKGLRITVESVEKFVEKHLIKNFNKEDLEIDLSKIKESKKRKAPRRGRNFVRDY